MTISILLAALSALSPHVADFGAKGGGVGSHCDLPRMDGNVGLGEVIREIGDRQSGGGLPEEEWAGGRTR